MGASVGTSEDTEARISALVEAGVDVVVVDTAHGHSQGVLDQVVWIKQHYPSLDVIGGNVATKAGAQALIDAGVDAVKVGYWSRLDLYYAHRRRRWRTSNNGHL